jgi:hypothetical protein
MPARKSYQPWRSVFDVIFSLALIVLLPPLRVLFDRRLGDKRVSSACLRGWHLTRRKTVLLLYSKDGGWRIGSRPFRQENRNSIQADSLG